MLTIDDGIFSRDEDWDFIEPDLLEIGVKKRNDLRVKREARRRRR